MLQSIRDNAQGWIAWVIVIVISIPFTLWGIQQYLSPTQETAVAKVNDVEIPTYEYQRTLQAQREQFRRMLGGRNMDLSQFEAQFKQNAIQQMIDDEVLIQTARNASMGIGDAHLASRIHDFQAFQDSEGQFSKPLYERALQSQGLSPSGFEAQMRRAMVTDQWRTGINQSSFTTANEQQDYTRLKEQQRAITYVTVPTKRFSADIKPSDSEIEVYYQAHTADYMTDAKVSMEYIELTSDALTSEQELSTETLQATYEERRASYTTPAEWKARHILLEVPADADETKQTEVLKQAQDLYQQLQDGADFAELAKTYSSDTGSAKQGGDLGWFGTGRMVKPFEEAVAQLAKDQISEPVKSPFGYHIIQLTDKKPEVVKPFAEVAAELKATLLKEQNEVAFYERAEEFANLVFEYADSLDTPAELIGLKKHTTTLFTRQGLPNDPLLSNQKVLSAAFSDTVLKEGLNSEAIEIEPMHVVALRLKEHQPSQPKPLAEVKAAITATLQQQQAVAEAEKLAQSMLTAIQQQHNPNLVVEQQDLAWSEQIWISRRAQKPQREIIKATFTLPTPTANQAIYQRVKLANGDQAIFALLDVQQGKIAEGDDNNTTDSQQQALATTEFNQFLADLKAEATIQKFDERL